VIEIKFTPNPAYTPDSEVSPYICPVTKLEVGGRYRFVAISECGCVISQRALREVPSKECLNCGKLFDTKNTIILNNTEEEIEKLKKEIQERRTEKRSKKKIQKKKSPEARRRDGKESQTTTNVTNPSTICTTTTSASLLSKASDTGTTIKETNQQSNKKRKNEELPHYLDPTYVDKEVYASIFTSSLSKKPKPFEETFLCRNVARV